MVDRATERIHVNASAERCWEIAADLERYPSWAADVKEVTVLSRDKKKRATKAEFKVSAIGRNVRYVLAYDYAQAPNGFSWAFVEGDMVKRLDGSYHFASQDGGTLVTYELEVDLAIPLPGILKRTARGRLMGTALKELKREAERNG